jgi:hypothetical protein
VPNRSRTRAPDGPTSNSARFGEQIHHHPGLFRADREVHGAADGGDRLRVAGVPVGQIAVHGHLERAEHADVEVTTAHHAERVRLVEVRGARQLGHRDLAGVDEVRIDRIAGHRRPHAKQPVLGVQDDILSRVEMVGDQCGGADPEVHVGAVGNVGGDALRERDAVEAHRADAHARSPIATTRST